MVKSRFPRTNPNNVRRLEDVFPTEEIYMPDHPRNRGKDYIPGEMVEEPADFGETEFLDDDTFEYEEPKYRSVEEYREWHIAKMVSVILWSLTFALVVLMMGGTYQLLEWFFGV